jgi:hypothetical protein
MDHGRVVNRILESMPEKKEEEQQQQQQQQQEWEDLNRES